MSGFTHNLVYIQLPMWLHTYCSFEVGGGGGGGDQKSADVGAIFPHALV